MIFEKIYKKNQNNKYKEIKILGFQVYKKSLEWAGRFVKRTFLNGLFVFQYDLKCHTFSFRLFDLEYFDFNILKTGLKYSYRIWYLFFLPIWIKNASGDLLKRFLKEIFKKAPKYDEYYIFMSHTGEFFLLMHHFHEWIKENESKNYVLVFTQKSLQKVCKMFYADIPTVYVSTKMVIPVISRAVKSSSFKYKNKKIFVPTYAKYFQDVEKSIMKKDAHYYNCLKEHLKLSDNLKTYSISDKAKEKVSTYIKDYLGDKFVIISPESLSNVAISKDFWEDITEALIEKGYKVFCNTMSYFGLIDGSMTSFFTYEEAIELSNHASGIIGLRSGFFDCVSQVKPQKHVLYTDFKNRPGFMYLPAKKVKSGFSVSKLPNVDNKTLYEYDVNDYDSMDDLLEEIINYF